MYNTTLERDEKRDNAANLEGSFCVDVRLLKPDDRLGEVFFFIYFFSKNYVIEKKLV